VRVRLQKLLAQAGYGSRRHCERLLVGGQVTVNGQTVTRLGSRVDAARDVVSVAGQPVRVQRRCYVLLNKPAGYLCTNADTHGRPRVLDLLPASLPRLYSVGRLDRDTEGLLLLTNDGNFSLRLTHPRYKMPKTYQVEVAGNVTPEIVARLQQGVRSDGETLRAERLFDIRRQAGRSRLQLILREGKKRQVRRMFAAVGCRVLRLRRIAVGHIRLGHLKPGQWRYLTDEEVRQLVSD
jgi:pseudouridine synthase